VYSRDVADGLVRLADPPSLSRTVYNLGSGRLESAETWCAEIAKCVPGFDWRHAATDEVGNVDSHTGFHRGPMDITKIARDTGYAPRHGFADAAAAWWSWTSSA
jgi:nucleoside-diphosphate-sugar epimerase